MLEMVSIAAGTGKPVRGTQELTPVSDAELPTMIAAEAEITAQEARLTREPAANSGPLFRGGEPDITLFSGAATLIQPCSQAGGEPDLALFLGLRRPDQAQFFGRSGSPPPMPTRWA